MRTLVTLPCLLALAVPAGADIFTVPSGASIQAAVDAALAAGGDNEVRVATGHFVGVVRIDGIDSGTLRLTGGWLPGFLLQGGAEGTVLDGGGGFVVHTFISGVAEVDVANFSITGSTSVYGAILAGAWGHSTISVRDNIVRDNHVVSDLGSVSAGIWASGETDCHLDISGNRFTGNSAVGPTSGLAVAVGGDGHVRFTSNQIRNNSPDRDGGLVLVQGGTLDVNDNDLEWNGLVARPMGFALAINCTGESASARRNTLVHNQALDQVRLAGPVVFSDSLIARNPYSGVRPYAGQPCANKHFTNLTIADNAGVGLSTASCAAGDEPTLTNSILFGDGTELDGAITASHSLIGVDPSFLDRAGEDYRLAASSRAIDAGLNPPPEGELEAVDLYGRPRVQGRAVDMGALETPAGAPVGCRVLDWDDGFRTWPIPPDTNACRCVADPGLQQFNCGFMLPDIFLSARGPLHWSSGVPVRIDWTIDPWTDVQGAYGMSAEVLTSGNWLPQQWQGPTAPSLKRGTLVVEPFIVKLPPSGRGELRTHLKYKRSGAPNSSSLAIELVLPDPKVEP